jgi:sulfite reductase beta subunit-like hemoprotein
VAERVHKADLPALLRPVLERYRDERRPDEGLGDFVIRAGIERLEPSPPATVGAGRVAGA